MNRDEKRIVSQMAVAAEKKSSHREQKAGDRTSRGRQRLSRLIGFIRSFVSTHRCER